MIKKIIFIAVAVTILQAKAANFMAQGYSYNEPDPVVAAEKALTVMEKELNNNREPDLVILTCTNDYNDVSDITEAIVEKYPDADIWGLNTGLGFYMNSDHEDGRKDRFDKYSIGMLGFCTNDHEFQIHGKSFERDMDNEQMIKQFVSEMNPEKPRLILLSTTGIEKIDNIFTEIREKYGACVPIFGGLVTSRKERISKARLFAGKKILKDPGISALLIYTDRNIGYNFQTGFREMGARGIATEVEGRKIKTIDNKPALEVFQEWTGEDISQRLKMQDKAVVNEYMFGFPIAREYRSEKGRILVSTAVCTHEDGDNSLYTYTYVQKGDRLVQMKVTEKALAIRPYLSSLKARKMLKDNYCGGLSMYCGGAYNWMNKHGTPELIGEKYQQAFKGKPFLALFVGGEFGCSEWNKHSYHANFMQNTVVFGE